MFETPSEDDWPEVLRLANASVADVPGAGPQDEWLANRRGFADRPGFASGGGLRRHLVCRDPASRRAVGYGAVEHDPQAPNGAFRLFVVTEPSALETVGVQVLEQAFETLAQLGARTAWFTEYAADSRLVSFVRRQGFEEVRRFDWRGAELVTLEKKLV